VQIGFSCWRAGTKRICCRTKQILNGPTLYKNDAQILTSRDKARSRSFLSYVGRTFIST
jgi:hypothetical protein